MEHHYISGLFTAMNERSNQASLHFYEDHASYEYQHMAS
jgi:hypothetical protein